MDTHILPASAPTSSTTRRRISSAALLVKVMASICHGSTPETTRRAMRRVEDAGLARARPRRPRRGGRPRAGPPPAGQGSGPRRGLRSRACHRRRARAAASSGSALVLRPAIRPRPPSGGRSPSRSHSSAPHAAGSSRGQRRHRSRHYRRAGALPGSRSAREVPASLPLDGSRGLGRHVVGDAVHARHLVDDTARDPLEHVVGQAAPSRPSWRPRS